MYHCIKKKTYKPIIYSVVLILVGFASLVLVLPKTNFYKNIEIHLDYLEVDNVFEVFTEYELVDHFIFSQRLTFLENKNDLYVIANIFEKIENFHLLIYKNNNLYILVKEKNNPFEFNLQNEITLDTIEMSKKCYDACTSEKKLVIIKGAEHGISYLQDPETYVNELNDFFKQV